MVIRIKMLCPSTPHGTDRDSWMIKAPIEDGDKVEIQMIDADGTITETVIVYYDRRLGLSLRHV